MDILHFDMPGGATPGYRCNIIVSCAIHGREEAHHFTSVTPYLKTSAPAIVQLGRVVLAALLDRHEEWEHACRAFRHSLMLKLGHLPIAADPIAPYEALRATLLEIVELSEAFRRLAELPVPRHVCDGDRAWVEDAPGPAIMI